MRIHRRMAWTNLFFWRVSSYKKSGWCVNPFSHPRTRESLPNTFLLNRDDPISMIV